MDIEGALKVSQGGKTLKGTASLGCSSACCCLICGAYPFSKGRNYRFSVNCHNIHRKSKSGAIGILGNPLAISVSFEEEDTAPPYYYYNQTGLIKMCSSGSRRDKEELLVCGDADAWKSGDVVTVILNGEEGRIDFEINGKWQGGVENIEKRNYHMALETCGCNGEHFDIVE